MDEFGRFLLYTLRESTSLYRRVAGVPDPPVGIPSLPCQRELLDRIERRPRARRCPGQGDSQCGRPRARSQVVWACRGREGGRGGHRSRHRDAADRGLRRLCQRPVDGARARQPHRQGHRHHPAQGRARRPLEGGGRGQRLRRLARRPRPQGRLPGAAEGARRLARQARQGVVHPAARRQSAEARHDRSARADPAQAAWPSSTSPCPSRPPTRRPSSTTSRWPSSSNPTRRPRGSRSTASSAPRPRSRSTPRSTSASSRSWPTSSGGAGCRPISAAATSSSMPATIR